MGLGGGKGKMYGCYWLFFLNVKSFGFLFIPLVSLTPPPSFNWMHWPGPENKEDLSFDAITNVTTKWQSPLVKRCLQDLISDILFAHQYFYFYILAQLLLWVELRDEPYKGFFVVGILAMLFIFLSISFWKSERIVHLERKLNKFRSSGMLICAASCAR